MKTESCLHLMMKCHVHHTNAHIMASFNSRHRSSCSDCQPSSAQC